MLFVTPLTEAEEATLNDAYKYHPKLWTRIRAHCILLSNQHYKLGEIASIHTICRQAVSNAIYAWENIGLVGLVDENRSGRPKKIMPEQVQELISNIKESPRSIKKVLAEFSEKYNMDISLNTLRTLCKKENMSWKRVRKSIKDKQDKEEFELSKNIVHQLITLYKEGKINLYYADESGFSLTPSIPYAWQKRDEPIEIPSARSPRLNVLGFLDRACQFESFVFTGSITTDVVISCFDSFSKYCEKSSTPTVVLVDNSPTHTSDKFDKKTIEWCTKGLVVVPISRYSPELNIIEILWRKIKYEWMPFSAYKTFDDLRESLFHILAGVGTKFSIKFG